MDSQPTMQIVFVCITPHQENHASDGGDLVPPVLGAVIKVILVLAGSAGIGVAIRDAFSAPPGLPLDISERFKPRLRPLQQTTLVGLAVGSIGLFAVGLGYPVGSDMLVWLRPPFAWSWQVVDVVGFICAGLGTACILLASSLMKRYLRRVLPADAYNELYN